MRYLAADTAKKISKIGLGTWQFGSSEWGYGETYAGQEAHAIVRRALELGVTLFDTAEIYSSGRSERILGRALGADREQVVLATKVWPLVPGARMVEQRCRASARRMGVGGVDLYQVHWPNPLIRDKTIMSGMRAAQQAGLVAEVGVSSYPAERWQAAERALGARILSNQVGYSLVHRSPEFDVLPFAESSGRVVIAFSPLAQGLLSGRYHDAGRPANQVRVSSPLFDAENLCRTNELISVLRAVAQAHRATPAQIALAWVLRRPAVAAIPGASSVAQLEENVAAAEIDLSEDEYQALCVASAPFCRRAEPVRSQLGRIRHDLAALRHTAKGGRYLLKTAWHDHNSALTPVQARANRSAWPTGNNRAR